MIQHVGLHPYTFWQSIQGGLQIEAHQAALSCNSMPQGGAKAHLESLQQLYSTARGYLEERIRMLLVYVSGLPEGRVS